MSDSPSRRVISGHVESFEVDGRNADIILRVRLNPDESHGDLSESEVHLSGPLFIPSEVEGTILDLIAALDSGGGSDE